MPEPESAHDAPRFESVEQIQAMLGPIMRAIAAAVGPSCEVVLHDLSSRSVDLEHTIAAIVNGTVTGRRVGGPSSNFGFDVLADDGTDHDAFGYRGITHDGRELRSSSIYFRNPAGRIIAALCINYDVSAFRTIKAMLDSLEPEVLDAGQDSPDEINGPDLNAVVDDMITRSIAQTGRPAAALSRDERVRIVKLLDERGVTGVTNGMVRIAQRLNVSRSTAYQYLDEARRA